MSYSKEDQTKSKKIERKTCKQCGKNRELRFFKTRRSFKCNECKRKNKRVRKRKKGKKARLKRELDSVVGDVIKKRDNYTCQWCKKKIEASNCHTSHVITRKNKRLRWDLKNLKTLCYHCHIQRWHKNPLEATEWFKNKFPDRYKYLMREKNKPKKWTESELESLITEYQSML